MVCSVAGTLVLPGTDVMRGDTDRELWPLLAEVLTAVRWTAAIIVSPARLRLPHALMRHFPHYRVDTIPHNTPHIIVTATLQVRPSLVYAGPALFERLYHRLVALYQERSGVERLLIDWGSSRVREGAAQAANSPEQHRRVVAGISQSIARATVCKKFKV